MEGQETEVDRSVIEHLRDPLIHLLRNAVDHGIEAPEERLAARFSRRLQGIGRFSVIPGAGRGRKGERRDEDDALQVLLHGYSPASAKGRTSPRYFAFRYEARNSCL